MDKPSGLQFFECEPHPALVQHVLHYWKFEAGELDEVPYMHHVTPDGCISLVYGLPSVNGEGWIGLTSPRLREIRVPVLPGAQWWGVRFWPDALGSLLHLLPGSLPIDDGSSLPDAIIRLKISLGGCETFEEACHILDASLMDLLPQTAPLDGLVRMCVERIVATRGQMPVGELAEELGLSERHLQRRFRRAVGLTPKQFARIRRFRASAGNVLRSTPEAWGRVASENGYADQAHMTREFSALVGLPPTTFQKRVGVIEHRDVSP